MRGRVVLLGLLLLLLPLVPLSAQCPYAPLFSGPFRSTVLDLAVDDTYLWAATSYGVSLYDRSVDPPALLSTVAVPGVTSTIRATGGVAYAGSGTSVAVVRREGRTARLVRLVDVGATINDLLLASRYLYVAGANGITQLDLLDPLNPTVANAPSKFPMSGTAAYSLAVVGSSIIAADGDSTLEVYSLGGLPVRTKTINALPRSLSVRSGNALLFVSDNLQTDVFSADTNFTLLSGPLPFGTTSVSDGNSGSVVFLSGADRRITAYDFATVGSPVPLFTGDLLAAGGTFNRVYELVSTPTRLYAAAGDGGVASYDVSRFQSPYAVHSSAIGWSTGVLSLGSTVITAQGAGGLTELAQNASGLLTQSRHWDTARVSLVHDATTNGLLLTAAGATVTLWSLIATTPASVGDVTLPANVHSAVLVGATVYAVLDDHTLWRVTMQDTPPKATQLAVGGSPSFVARSGTQLALADLNADGSTTLRYYPTGDFSAAPASLPLAGSATGGISLSNGTIAASTFAGLQLANMNNGSLRQFAQSDGVARKLVLSGSTLLVQTTTQLQLWDATAGTLARQLALPAGATTFDWLGSAGLDLADVVTTDGVSSIGFRLASEQPSRIAAPSGNAYYKKEQLSGNMLYLFDGRNVDSFELGPGGAPSGFASVRVPGAIDFAVTPSGVVTLTGTGVVSLSTRTGTLLASATIAEGSDALPLSLSSVAGMAWVSLLRGCQSGTCEKKTLVFDPRGGVLAQSATMSGAVVEATVSGTRAYVITDLPAEIRMLNVGDPAHPALIVSRAAEGSAKMPVSVAYAGGTVYALGEKLYAYDETTLAKTGEPLGTYVTDAYTAYIDQRVRIDGGCAFVSGRSLKPQQYTLTSPTVWTPVNTPAVPAAVKGLELTAGRAYLLTDDSLEIWSTASLPPTKHRGVK